MSRRLSPLDLAYNAAVDAANHARQRAEDAVDDYNRAAKAAESIHRLGLHPAVRLRYGA